MRIIATDLDGTLLNSNHELSIENKNSLLKAMKLGHKVVIVTGRDNYAAVDIAKNLNFKEFGGLISSSNGSRVYDCKKEKFIINHFIDKTLVDSIIDYGKSLGFDLVIYHDGKILVEKTDVCAIEYLRTKNKMPVIVNPNLKSDISFEVSKILFTSTADNLKNKFGKFSDKFEGLVEIVHSLPETLDVMPIGISKGRSLRDIADYYGIKIENTVSFGDELNDLDFIKNAGIGVAMGNSIDEIKAIADYITLTNDENGVADYINKNILI